MPRISDYGDGEKSEVKKLTFVSDVVKASHKKALLVVNVQSDGCTSNPALRGAVWRELQAQTRDRPLLAAGNVDHLDQTHLWYVCVCVCEGQG